MRKEVIIGLGVTLMASGWYPVARADPATPAFPRRTVVVLPCRDFRVDVDGLFVAGTPPSVTSADSVRMGDAAAQAMAQEPEVNCVRIQDRGSEKPGDESEKAIVARGFLHLGVELYRNIRLKEALGALERGIDAARKQYLDVLEPELVSDLYLYLGLSYMEQGSAALAHVAFKDMFFVTPQRHFKKGYFPPETEQAIRAAAVDFVKTFPKDDPMVSQDRLASFLRAVKASAVAWVSIAAEQRVRVRVFEPGAEGKGLVVSQSAETPFQEPAVAEDGISRAISAWLACTRLPSREREREAYSRFHLDTTGAYSLYIKHPTRGVFHNTGIGIGLSFQALDNLDTFARVTMFTSFPDRYNDLVEGFTSINALIGLGYSLRWSWGRAFLHIGMDVNYLSDFASTTNPNCKFFGVGSDCSEADFFRLPSHVLMGINTSLGTRLNMFGPVFAVMRTSVSAYFFPFGKASRLNFPFTAELGLGYGF